jgi:GntR family transcriptional regulator
MGQSRAGSLPRYRVIATDLAEKIRAGAYPPGTALPAQRELGAHYQVALATIRQSLQALSDDGLVVVEAGRGTFAAPTQPAYRLDTLRSFVEDLNEQGHQVSTEVIASSLRRPTASAAAHLQLENSQRALRLERLRLLAGVPAIHQVSWVAPPYAVQLRDVDFSGTSLYGALTAAGASLVRAAERVTAAGLSAAIARRLQRPQGSPAFVSDRITYALDGSAVVFDRAMIVGTLMEIRANRTTNRVTVSWGSSTPDPAPRLDVDVRPGLPAAASGQTLTSTEMSFE